MLPYSFLTVVKSPARHDLSLSPHLSDFCVSLSRWPTTQRNRLSAMKVFEIERGRGHGFLLTVPCVQNDLKEHAMSPSKRYAKKHAEARQRRRLHAHERLERDRRQAQRAIEALEQQTPP